LEEYFNVGAVPSISSNEKTNGIVWAIQGSGGSGTAATLHAYDAGNLGVELYNSGATQGRDALATAIKFQTPTIVNGKVYVGLASEVGVFGIGKWPAMPAFSAQSGRYPNQVTFNVTESTPGTFIAFTTDGTIPTRTSPRFHGPVTLTSSSTVKARAFQDGAGASSVATADFLINPTIGFGSGLAGKYFANNIHGSAPFPNSGNGRRSLECRVERLRGSRNDRNAHVYDECGSGTPGMDKRKFGDRQFCRNRITRL
jgi:hypothetical protein